MAASYADETVHIRNTETGHFSSEKNDMVILQQAFKSQTLLHLHMRTETFALVSISLSNVS